MRLLRMPRARGGEYLARGMARAECAAARTESGRGCGIVGEGGWRDGTGRCRRGGRQGALLDGGEEAVERLAGAAELGNE